MSSNFVNVYTDGSSEGGQSSWAAIFYEPDGQLLGELSGNLGPQSNNQIAGEIEAAIWAIKYALKRNKIIFIHHDLIHISKWCLGEWRRNDDDAKRLKKWYDYAVSKDCKIHFVKVKGHSGQAGNERADVVAGLAAKLPPKPKQIPPEVKEESSYEKANKVLSQGTLL